MEPIDEDEPGFFQRFRVVIILGVLILLGAGAYAAFGKKEEPKRKTTSVVSIMPPLPPPPPPPPTPPPKEEPPPPDNPKQPEFQAEEKPEKSEPAKAPQPDEPPAAPLGTSVQGDGPDGFGLSGNGNGGTIGGTGTGKGGGGTKYGWYAGQVQSKVAEALRNHRRTRSAALSIKVRIWADNTGRVTKATLAGSTGDPAVDAAIQNEILTGLRLAEPPPEGMPMPIVMRLNARRPN